MSLPEKKTEWCNPEVTICEWTLCNSVQFLAEERAFENNGYTTSLVRQLILLKFPVFMNTDRNDGSKFGPASMF